MDDRDIHVLLDADTIADRVDELGLEIRKAFGDEPILFIGVLKGSIIFMSDLARATPGDVELAFLGVASYHGTESTGTVRLTHDLTEDITDLNVVIVEDIVDTGLTLSYLRDMLSLRRPKSLAIATLLDKPSRRVTPVPIDFTGFTIEDRFVIGYGLDLDQKFRNLPYVGEIVG